MYGQPLVRLTDFLCGVLPLVASGSYPTVQDPSIVNPTRRPTAEIVISLVLAVVFMLMFFRQPHAGTLSAQTWRVELAAAVFLCGILAFLLKLSGIDVTSRLGRRL